VIVEERDLYRVDGYIVGEFVLPADENPPFELEMVCYSTPDWHELYGTPCSA
jgi:hypothetical protein